MSGVLTVWVATEIHRVFPAIALCGFNMQAHLIEITSQRVRILKQIILSRKEITVEKKPNGHRDKIPC